MSIRKKIVYFMTLIFTSVIMLFVVTGCDLNLNWYFKGSNTYNGNLDVEFTEGDMEEIRADMKLIDNELDGTNASTVISGFNGIVNKFYMLQSYYMMSYVKYSQSKTAVDLDFKNTLYEYLSEVRNYVLGFYTKAYNSSLRDQFYRGWSEEEIEKVLKYNKSEELIELENKKAELEALNETYSLEELMASDDTYKTFAQKQLIEYIKINKQIAKIKGFDSASSYFYDTFDRKYQPSETLNMSKYLAEYVKTAYVKAEDELKALYKSMSQEEKSAVDKFINNGTMSISDMDSYFSSYANYVGDSFLSCYKNAIKDGSFYSFTSTNSAQGAFTTYLYYYEKPICYFGYGYSKPLTMAHEYGHYYAMSMNESGIGDLDIAEMHSQTDEILYTVYLDNENYFQSEKVEKYVKLYDIYDGFFAIMAGIFVNQFEMEVYSLDDYTNVDFDALAKKISDEVFPFAFNYERYWRVTTFDDPFYYISYAISGISALNSYKLASTDFSQALSNYKDLCSVDEEFIETIAKYGYDNPLNESSYKNIGEIVDSIVSEIETL